MLSSSDILIDTIWDPQISKSELYTTSQFNNKYKYKYYFLLKKIKEKLCLF